MRSNASTAFVSALLCTCIAVTAAGDDKEPDLPLEGKTERLAFSTTEGSWMSLDVAPDGASFVFDLLGDLYSLPVAGGKATRITSGLAYDSQPQISPDGRWIAFISDRNGSDNLWVTRRDGSEPRILSDEKQFGLISPNWLPDSKRVVVTRTAIKPEFTLYHVDGGSGVTLSGPDAETKVWGVGAEVSADGRYLYFAQKVDSNGPVENFPATQVSRYEFASGHVDQLTRAEGGGMRPVLSPDGRLLVYATRENTRTGLRVRDLTSGDDRWLTYPVQRDAQENFRPPSRDVLPGYSFTPDGESIIFNADGGFHRVAVATGERTAIAFSADVELDVGPDLTSAYRVPEGPLTATLIHDPQPSPDGSTIVSSVLSKLYVADRDGGEPRRLTDGDAWEFKPVWSPDGRWIAYVTWSMDNGGHIWRTRANGRGRPQRLSGFPAFYTDLVYGPDGESLYAMRGNEYMRHQTFSEFTGLGIPLELVSLPADGGPQTLITPARKARQPHFSDDPERIFLYDEKGLFSIRLDGSDRRAELVVTGPMGNRRSEEPLQAEMVTMSPSGEYALALVNKQVWIISTAKTGGTPPTIAVSKPALPAVRLTDIGADFFGWNRSGDAVHWAIGNTWYERPVASIEFYKAEEPADENDAENASEEETDEPFLPADLHESVRARQIDVVVARDTPSGSVLLSGANLVTMSGANTDAMASTLSNHDVLIRDNRIAAIGPAGTLPSTNDVTTIDVSGKTIVPGFIDTHAHWEFRTGDVLEPHNWTLVANLAYGVTAGLDVQTSYKDYLAYRDFQQTGQSIGQRAFMTARGIFGNNDFQSYDATRAYLRRFSEHYHTKNIKSYVVGNRKQRQWVALASKELGLMPTTEGAGDQKLDITHAIDGMHGNEHNLPDLPIFNDVVHLFAQTRTAYTPTLIVQYNATNMREYFFTRTDVGGDEKLRRFYPANRLDELTERRPGWQRDDEFVFAEGAALAAKIQRAGGLVGVGGHAELQGLGYHWEMWAYAMGGMTPAEILRAATIDAAHIIGVAQDLGSIEVGKLADLVILDASPLDDIRNTTTIHRVMQNGRLYDGDTLDQVWPEVRPLPPFWWWSDDDPRYQPRTGENPAGND